MSQRRNLSTHDPAAFEYTVLLDAWLWGNRLFWSRRARQIEAARPRPGDFTGRSTPAEVRARDERLTQAAQACRHRADFLDAARTALEDTTTALEQGAHA